MYKAICPGSFDPVTYGHIDIIKRAGAMFDEVLVAILINPSKNPLFTIAERTELLNIALKGMKNVKIVSFNGLLAEFAKENNANVIVKGLRNASDFEYELQMASINLKLNPNIETVFLGTKPENALVSSSMVKQLAMFGGDISEMIPDEILSFVKNKFDKGGKI